MDAGQIKSIFKSITASVVYMADVYFFLEKRKRAAHCYIKK